MKNRVIKTFEGFHKWILDKHIVDRKSYVSKKIRWIRKRLTEDDSEYDMIISKMVFYDENKFIYKQTPYSITIYPNSEYLVLYKRLCEVTDSVHLDNLYFNIEVTGNRNQIDFSDGVPVVLRGVSLGYKLYKLVIYNNDYISSDHISSKDAYNLWYNLLQDNDLYAVTSNLTSFLIKKDISDVRLKEILNIFLKDENLELDEDLKIKIDNLYGNVGF